MNRIVLLSAALVGLGAVPARAGFVNGGFQAGDLTGWTTYTTASGTIGTPTVVSYDTTGTGPSLAVQLRVGHTVTSGTHAGGGLLQALTLADGTYHFGIDLASQLPPTATFNSSGGRFQLLVDGTVVASHDFGQIVGPSPERRRLEADLDLTAGTHEFRLQFTRPFTTSANTPFQYLDNASLEPGTAAVPVPGGAVLFGLGLATLGAGRVARRKSGGA